MAEVPQITVHSSHSRPTVSLFVRSLRVVSDVGDVELELLSDPLVVSEDLVTY